MLSGCFPFYAGRRSKRLDPMKTKEVHPDHHVNHLPADQAKKAAITLTNHDQEDKEGSIDLKKLDKEDELDTVSVHAPSAAGSASSSQHLIPSPTPSQKAERKKPSADDFPASCITLYVGPNREVFKVPLRFIEYRSFLELLEEAEKREKELEKSTEITEDLGDAILLDFVNAESFREMKRCLEWNEKAKKAKEDGYYAPLWANYFAKQQKKDDN